MTKCSFKTKVSKWNSNTDADGWWGVPVKPTWRLCTVDKFPHLKLVTWHLTKKQKVNPVYLASLLTKDLNLQPFSDNERVGPGYTVVGLRNGWSLLLHITASESVFSIRRLQNRSYCHCDSIGPGRRRDILELVRYTGNPWQRKHNKHSWADVHKEPD